MHPQEGRRTLKGRAAARRYAKALMDLAKRDDRVEETGAQLQQHHTVFQSNTNLRQILENPSVDADDKTNILRAILDRTQPTPLVRNFLLLLLEKDRLNQFDLVCQHYEVLANEELQRVVAQVTTATELGQAQRQAVIRKIADITHKTVILETHQDPTLLGGLVVRIGNIVLDGSLRGQLLRLRETLIGG
jgi:F-type H+-transporting ATPase subunit delta